ncbi:MAG: low-specificity L-threonine aldolase [bacterium]
MTAVIDLRSDTVTAPCDSMRAAMARAAVGDDVYGEDPTVLRLERKLAEMTDFDDGLFFPSGTQSNLAALLSHCQRGDEYIVAQGAHTYRYEAGGAAVLGSIQPQPLECGDDGLLDLATVEAAIKDDDFHFAKTRLLALENTFGGRVVPLDYIERAAALARAHGLALHLDGARAFNAAVESGVEVARIARHFDSVSICLSKGLGAPVGSVLCAGRELIARARRWRKMLGGGMRQAGVLAAAGIHALDRNIDRLRDDHRRARDLAQRLLRIDGIEVVGGRARTNMVFIAQHSGDYDALRRHAKRHGLLLAARTAQNTARLVTHMHIGDDQVATSARIIAEFFERG